MINITILVESQYHCHLFINTTESAFISHVLVFKSEMISKTRFDLKGRKPVILRLSYTESNKIVSRSKQLTDFSHR